LLALPRKITIVTWLGLINYTIPRGGDTGMRSTLTPLTFVLINTGCACALPWQMRNDLGRSRRSVLWVPQRLALKFCLSEHLGACFQAPRLRLCGHAVRAPLEAIQTAYKKSSGHFERPGAPIQRERPRQCNPVFKERREIPDNAALVPSGVVFRVKRLGRKD